MHNVNVSCMDDRRKEQALFFLSECERHCVLNKHVIYEEFLKQIFFHLYFFELVRPNL